MIVQGIGWWDGWRGSPALAGCGHFSGQIKALPGIQDRQPNNMRAFRYISYIWPLETWRRACGPAMRFPWRLGRPASRGACFASARKTIYGRCGRRTMTFLVRYVVAVATLAACATANAAGAQPRLASAVTCVNPSSGATWQINIDYDRSTVDSNPATVSNDEISWRDAKDGWHYTLGIQHRRLFPARSLPAALMQGRTNCCRAWTVSAAGRRAG